jgi:HEAT repeat protein
MARRRALVFTPREMDVLQKGISNQAYHYLGSATIMARIGKGFAEAAVGLLMPQRPLGAPFSEENPDFTQGGTVPEGATHDWNLGPTGARGWMYGNELETSEARQIHVTQVDARSPAARVLRPGDVILGVAGRPFAYDPRTELGKAVGAAEAADGELALIRWRDGKTTTAVVELEVMGPYGATAPFECRKSKRIFDRGCEALARTMKADPNAGNPIVRSLNALALLSSGKRKYLPLVKKQVMWASQYSDPERRTYHSWFYGPINILLAEYVMATGDRRFLPDLKRITMEIVRGQSEVGSWGHRFVQANGRLAGYGMMNAPGLPLTVSLILARKAGVADPALDAAIDKSARLIRFYVGKGSVPYGDHHPWIQTHDDNGKNGAAALMFDLLGDAEAAAYFSRMSVASHGAERDTGHTGNFFNMLWAMPGVAVSGPHAAGAWMQEFGWYYDLARRWDGTYLHQGPPAAKPDQYHGWDCTGAYLLAYAQSLRKLHVTGRTTGVVEPVDARAAERLVADGRGWSPRLRIAAYAVRSDAELFAGLGSWSPVVRERSGMELARRGGDLTPRLISMLAEPDLHARVGACQALTLLGERAAPAVPALQEALHAEDLWLRVKAAEALAGIGTAAMSTVPDLLAMLARDDPESDPRGMQRRYLCFALFDRRNGLLGRSLAGVDREALYAAVRAGLSNEDGRARGSLESVYRNLSYEEIEPLLPAIHRAVMEAAPSGIMFADGIRLSGLEILAKHRIEEGLPLCIALIEPGRWGFKNRIERCLASLSRYGGAARSAIPRLRQLEEELAATRWKPEAIRALGIRALIREIEVDADPAALRPLPAPR